MNHLRKGDANLCKSIRDETALPKGGLSRLLDGEIQGDG
jgi:hypothetical protein